MRAVAAFSKNDFLYFIQSKKSPAEVNQPGF